VKVCTVAVPGAGVVGPAVAGAVVAAAVKQTNVIITRGQKDTRPIACAQILRKFVASKRFV